jgi:uncharacterized membrane protein
MISLPPVLFYVLGTVLIVFGALRAYHMGWKVRNAPQDPEDAERRPGRGNRYNGRQHLRFGLVWVAMGLFLVISTFLNAR